MKYTPTAVKGALIVTLEAKEDDRGFFARIFDANEFACQGLVADISQINNSMSVETRTLRGLHYQIAPFGECKLMRCISGSAFDVVVDLRPGSETFGHWAGATLTAGNREMMYVPCGCAHGFLTLEGRTEMLYASTAPYQGAAERIVKWNDPRFAVEWPASPNVMSDKDREAPAYDPAWHQSGY